MKKKVLFICTHNSARSHMAEGILRHMYGSNFDAYSAGTQPSVVRPFATEVMKEVGIDISGHSSKSIDEFQNIEFDYVVTVCDNARETCPFFPGKKIIHKGFEDPSAITGTKEEILAGYRRIRDEIKDWIKNTFSQKE